MDDFMLKAQAAFPVFVVEPDKNHEALVVWLKQSFTHMQWKIQQPFNH